MVVMIQAIETSYNGYRFRSRLEARWAVFFDALDVPYEYEKEGFNLGDGLMYLPDFWVPHLEMWVEIKGTSSDVDWRKIQYCAKQSERGVLVLSGNIGDHAGVIVFPYGPTQVEVDDDFELKTLINSNSLSLQDFFHFIEDVDWAICPRCTRLVWGVVCGDEQEKLVIRCLYCYIEARVRMTAKLARCDPRKSRELVRAYESARSARFEHGETPKVLRGRQNAKRG